jgi:hypothetical protein
MGLQFSAAVFGSFSAVRQCTIWAYQPLVHFVWLPQERAFCVTCFMSKLVAPCSLMMFASGIASFLRSLNDFLLADYKNLIFMILLLSGFSLHDLV